jgi:hypothetical protein
MLCWPTNHQIYFIRIIKPSKKMGGECGTYGEKRNT